MSALCSISQPRAYSSLPVVSLLHEVNEEYSDLLDRFAKLSQSADAKAEEIALRAKLTLDEVYSRFRADMFLSSLAESGRFHSHAARNTVLTFHSYDYPHGHVWRGRAFFCFGRYVRESCDS